MKAYLDTEGIRFVEVMGFQASKPKGTIETILNRLKATKLKSGKRIIPESADSFFACHNVSDSEAIAILNEYSIAVNMAGNDSDVSKATIPEWIKAEQEREKRKQAADDARSQKAVETSFVISNVSEALWKELVAKLKENTDALHRVHLSGSTSLMTPADKQGEQRCRVQVTNLGIDQTYTDLFYTPKGTIIRCWTQAGQQDDFVFVILSGGELGIVRSGRGTDPAMNASYMAQTIVKTMADLVRRKC